MALALLTHVWRSALMLESHYVYIRQRKTPMTIMRLWHREVAIEKADEYEKFMVERAAPDYLSVKGLLHLSF